MRNKKKFLALGLSVVMMSSMAVGAFAAENTETIQKRASGNATVEGSNDVDVDGWLTKDAMIDSSGSEINPSLPSYTGSEKPLDPSSQTTNWGDDTTADSSQLIVTAPTYLSFQVAGEGADANIQLTSNGNNVTGTILNQSCYIQGTDAKLNTVPKEVTVKATKTDLASGEQQFSVVDDIATAGDVNAVDGVYLHLGDNGKAKFAGMSGTELGTLAKGTKATTAEGTYAVNPSENKIYFADENGKATGVSTTFKSDYDGSMLHSDYTLNMTYTYIQ